MTREKRLGTGIYFSAEELIPTALLVLCAFLKTAAVTTMDADASILFLTESLGQNIPQILIAIAALILIIWPILAAFKEKSPLIPSFLLLIAAGISLLFYGASFFVPEQIFLPANRLREFLHNYELFRL